MTKHFDLAVIGSGSGNSIVNEDFADRRVAILEQGTFGGTCLNVGCIPTKMFAYPADLAHSAAHGDRLGLATSSGRARWAEIRDRIFRRIDPISVAGRHWRAESNPNVTLYEGHARFTGLRTLDTGTGETITADQIVLAAGSRAVVPPIEGLAPSPGSGGEGPAERRASHAGAPYHTSDTIMRIDELPGRLAVIGGGFVAAEFAHIFSSFGSAVTVVNRSGALLRAEDRDVSERFTALAQQRWDVRLNTQVTKVEGYDGGVRAMLDDGATLECDALLVATGRRPNSDGLDLARTGVEVADDGVVLVDAYQRTNVEGIWALGDLANRYQLKHVSNHEARVVQHNLLHPDDLVRADHDHVPSAVFSSPQVASGEEVRNRGLRYVAARQSFGDVAYGWAMEDTSSFVKVLADPETGLLIGAHLIGPQASNLIQPLIQAMAFGQTAADVARRQYWIHPALAEVVENALLGLHLGGEPTRTPG